jgi:hypothetical protein
MADIFTIRCEKWEEFVSKIRPMHVAGGYRIFRGHANASWKLSSTWERELASASRRLGSSVARSLGKQHIDTRVPAPLVACTVEAASAVAGTWLSLSRLCTDAALAFKAVW